MTRVLLFQLPPSGGDLYPISLGYIAAYLKHSGIDVILEDCTVEEPKSLKRISSVIEAFKPHVIGCSAYQGSMRTILSLADFIKHINPSITIILGGPQATFMPKEALLHMPSVDILCRGEGEVVLPAVCRRLKNQTSLKAVKGIVFRQDRIVIETPHNGMTADLDDFPSPYQSGVFNFADHATATMLVSRGCPFNCSFCYTPKAFGRNIRYHSTRRILQDISVCLDHGIRDFFFCDPSFTFDKRKVEAIMDGVIRKKWDIDIWCSTRSDLVDEHLLKKMAKGGVKKIAYGLETVDPVVLKAINKKITPAQFRKTIRMTQDAGIQAEVFTIYGLPQQTYTSACETLEFLKRLDIHISGNSLGQQACLYFGTAMSDNPEKFGIKVVYDKKRPIFLSPGFEFETEWMDRTQMELIRKRYMSHNLLHAFDKRKKSGDTLSDFFVSNYSAGAITYDVSKIAF